MTLNRHYGRLARSASRILIDHADRMVEVDETDVIPLSPWAHSQERGSWITAWAAASLATGTRGGEQLT